MGSAVQTGRKLIRSRRFLRSNGGRAVGEDDLDLNGSRAVTDLFYSKDVLVPIAVALIGLVGTLTGLCVGYRKWLADKRIAASKTLTAGRQKAYEELWEKVERLNVEARIEEIPQEDYSKRIAEINAFMLRSSVFIDDSDRHLVNAYIQAAHRFHEVVRSGEVDADINLGDTAIIPEHVLQQCNALRETQKRALALRETLLKKTRSVLSEAA
jgi:hypothetical protein